MIIRFENIDNPSYSAEFIFSSAGFQRAQYDFSDFVDVTDPDTSHPDNSYVQFLYKIFHNIFTNDFVNYIYLHPFPPTNISLGESIWNSFKVRFNNGSHYYHHFNECFDIWNGSGGFCDCYDIDTSEDNYSDCEDNFYSGFVTDSWTSGKCLKQSAIDNTGFNDSIRFTYTWTNYGYDGDLNFIYKGFLPTISFFEPNLNYPKFKIFAYDFLNFESADCKYGLFLHFVENNQNSGDSIFKTLKVGCFGVYQGNFYFENFYGNKVFVRDLNKRYFDFYDFFNTNTLNNISDFLEDNYSDFPVIDINSFGKTFVFELKKEDYSGVYMSTLDCECLNNAISTLSDELKIFNKSFSEAFNKVPLSGDGLSDFGSGSVFKSNDLDNIDFFDRFTEALTDSCGDLFGIAFGKSFLDSVNCNRSVFRNDCDKSIGVMFGDAFNDDCQGNYLGSVFKTSTFLDDEVGVADVFSYIFSEPYDMGRRSIFLDEDRKSVFKNNCNLGIADSFTEAFNLTDECKGSVFKANDNVWNGEDSLAGIWYKQLDYDYIFNNFTGSIYAKSAFYRGYLISGSKSIVNIPVLLKNSLFKNDVTSVSNSVFNFSTGVSISDILKRALFVSLDNYEPVRNDSVFSFVSGHSSNLIKILNHACTVNPNSIKFCEDVPFDFSGLPVPQVTVTNNVPVPDVDVDNNITVTPSTLDFSWDGFINGFVNPFFRRFSDDQDSLLNMLKNALFCQFKASGSGNVGWNFSVFKKLLYSEDSEDCSDKVGLPELDFFVAPDNIYINSDGKPTRYTLDEVYK